jgi:hypothetical protein
MKQRSPFLFAAVGVAPDQLQHRVLHDVERIVGIAEGEPCRQKRAPLDTGEKTIQGLCGRQRRFLIIGFSPATLSASSFCPDIRLRRWTAIISHHRHPRQRRGDAALQLLVTTRDAPCG